MRTVYLLSVWLHIISVTIWLGGMFFLILILLPITRRRPYLRDAGQLVHLVGVRFRWIGWICLSLLVLSGIFNVAYRGFTWADVMDGSLWRGPFGRTLGIKLILVAIVLALSAIHDFYIGPRATALWRQQPGDPRAARLRRQAGWIGRINFVLAVIIVALGVALVRGGI